MHSTITRDNSNRGLILREKKEDQYIIRLMQIIIGKGEETKRRKEKLNSFHIYYCCYIREGRGGVPLLSPSSK